MSQSPRDDGLGPRRVPPIPRRMPWVIHPPAAYPWHLFIPLSVAYGLLGTWLASVI